jgi:hypothetical protein
VFALGLTQAIRTRSKSRACRSGAQAYVRRRLTGFLVTLLTALASKGIQAQDTSYVIGFAPDTTCAEVHERAQREGGGDIDPRPPARPPGVQAPEPKPPGPWASFDVKRSFRSGWPTVRYTCDGNARVRTQTVEVMFETQELALADYAKYAKQLRPGLGEPCWDSDALGEEKRKSLQETDDFVIRLYRQRMEWHGPAVNTVLSISSRQGGLPQPRWFVHIFSVDSRVRNDDMSDVERKVRALGTCDPVVQLPSVSESDDAPTVLTKWFAHVRERGYPTIVDFLASQEKRRIHAAAIELARRANGTPSQAVLRGLAGDGIPTEETLAALERSTPDAWLRDLLHARFRGPDGLLRYSRMEILGTVPEGDIIHVIARMQVELSDGGIAGVQNFAFKRSGQRLEMQLPAELQSLELGFRLMTHTLTSTP